MSHEYHFSGTVFTSRHRLGFIYFTIRYLQLTYDFSSIIVEQPRIRALA